jgi:hypothetical protein
MVATHIGHRVMPVNEEDLPHTVTGSLVNTAHFSFPSTTMNVGNVQHSSGPCMSNTSPRWHVDQPIKLIRAPNV